MTKPALGFWSGAWAIAAASSLVLAASPTKVDPHRVFHDECGACHADASDIAHGGLVIAEGVLRGGSSGRDIARFLTGHHAPDSEAELDALYSLLLRQTRTGAVFKTRCRICHGRAKRLARTKLDVSPAGALLGRYTGRDMREFLPAHGRPGPGEVEVLYRVLEELVLTGR